MASETNELRGYQKGIAEDMEQMGITGIEPRWVEASMRLQYGTLCHLPRATFREEIRLSVQLEKEEPGYGEKCAESFGL